MGETILVLGGASSGKTAFAERLASEREPVTYLATATFDPTDPEMVSRIHRHRRERHVGWTTLEEPRHLAAILPDLSAKGGSILIDCLTLWVTNMMLGMGGGAALGEDDVLRQVERASEAARHGAARVVWVSNEVGSGGVAANPLARRFQDLQGLANQRLVRDCDAVHLCVAGLSSRLK